ncbi:MAG: hypothetical protein IJS29_02345 [Selenomonadaceae bacterium]|nr:hypothetical protein [Selenomonadaceae bacterium]
MFQAAYFCITEHLQREVDGNFDDGKLSLKLKTPPDEFTEAVFWTMIIGIIGTKKFAPDAIKSKFSK